MSIRFCAKKTSIFDELGTYGVKNNSTLDKICAFALAVSPLLQHYKGLYVNAGYTIFFIISPYILLKLFVKVRYEKISAKCFIAALLLLLFQLYKIFDHTIGLNKLLYGLFMLVFILAIASGCINVRYFVKISSFICCMSGIFLIAQYILFYLFRFHLQLVPTSLLLPESSVWILGAQTGLIGITGKNNGFYRPSAFFLEPSHLFIYCFPILCLVLLSTNIDRRKMKMAIIITIAIVLSTSGMGLGVTVGIWGVYFILYSSAGKNIQNKIVSIFSIKTVCILIIFLLFFILCYFNIEFFRNTVDRIFSSGNTGNSSAIDGRTRLARNLIESLSGKTMVFGLTDNVSNIEFNLPGFYSTLYKYGIIGVILSYLYYIFGLLRLKGSYFWINFIIILISFFTAHTHGTFYMLYYAVVLMNGYHMAGRSEDRSQELCRRQRGARIVIQKKRRGLL